MISLFRFFSLAALGIALLRDVSGQVVGVDFCGCQPATYEITLDFSISCEDNTVTSATDGIKDSACLEAGSSEETTPTTDLVPVFVSTIEIIDLKDRNNLVVTNYQDGYTSGSVITYTSVLASQGNETDASRIPNGFQINMIAQNAAGQTINSQAIVEFDNDCGIFPLLFPDDQLGWSRFVSYTPFIDSM